MNTNVENNCGKKEALIAYLYNEVSQPERTEFEQHLVSCGSCHNELQSFQGVRDELGTWQMPFVPHIEVVTPRTAMDALREFVRLVPGWLKLTSGLATAAAATLVVFALAGTRVSVGNGGFDLKFGVGKIALSAAAIPGKAMTVNSLSRADAEQMIQAAVAQAQAQAQVQTQAQLASLESKLNTAHQVQLQTATARLRQEQHRKLQIEMAKFDNGTRQTLTEWLLTATEASQEATSNEKNY